MIQFDLITLFPQVFNEHFNTLPFNRAMKENLCTIKLWNLREYALDSYGTVDDKPYGGGKGMVLRPEPITNALVDIYSNYYNISPKPQNAESINQLIKKVHSDENAKIIALSPRGNKYTQKSAKNYLNMLQITVICGRYEGIDARIEEKIATDLVSIGDYVLAGGEIPALAIMDSILRLKPGILDPEALKEESFADDTYILEHPQYTRPEEYLGSKVPDILISGNHKEIEKWKKDHKKQEKPN